MTEIVTSWLGVFQAAFLFAASRDVQRDRGQRGPSGALAPGFYSLHRETYSVTRLEKPTLTGLHGFYSLHRETYSVTAALNSVQ